MTGTITKQRNKYTYICVSVVLFALVMFIYRLAIKGWFWYDEAYSMAMIQHSYCEILQITSTDVHPPLYYFMLKGFAALFGHSLLSLSVFSFLGVVASYLLALFPIRKLFGIKVATLFIILLTVLPITQFLALEVRMYSWVMFFVLTCSVYAYKSYLRGGVAAYTIMTICAICAAYTHNYGLVAAGSIYLVFLFTGLRNKRPIGKFIVSLLIFLFVYSFWIPHLWTQFSNVQESYWIGTPTPKELLLYCYYFFSPKNPEYPYIFFSKTTMSVLLMLMLILLTLIIVAGVKLHGKEKTIKLKTANGFIAVFLLTMIIPITVSFLLTPIFVPRYECSVLGPLLLSASIYVVELSTKPKNRNLLIAAITILLILFVLRFFHERAYSIKNSAIDLDIKEFVESEKKTDNVIISSWKCPSTMARLSAYITDNRYYIIGSDSDKPYPPFNMKGIMALPDTGMFYIVTSAKEPDLRLREEYKIKNVFSTHRRGPKIYRVECTKDKR
ncbi:putative membrane protein [Dysgonomonas sp. PH5-45]|uniref:glycosyltransferase family 39 protein n=1 Tax=unclassified Dysgonomonas TaxID=2630389 RepID=UPI002476372C|nr:MULTISPECIES: glycosyltransferase family 39 protein [unclassified Dysgonomonas]MDH6355171.1 putative membrane protein [Dysgonomonas sp. PH5-45]MDH6388103.1 putative membrane protein [Dysgonomonas sp. PH5-37]